MPPRTQEIQDVSETSQANGTTRRSFLTWSAALGSTALIATTSGCALGPKPKPLPTTGPAEGEPTADSTVWSACTVNCGSRCPVKLQVKEGTIIRVIPESTGDDSIGFQQIRACVRGRSIKNRIYNPDRLQTPLRRRPGTKRGDGQWDEITWEEALDEIADTIKRLVKDYGNESIYLNYGTGTLGATVACSWPPKDTPFARLMNLYGGYLNHYSDYSTCQITSSYPYHYGGWVATNTFDDVKNSDLQIMFGNNPLETRMSGGGETFVTQQVKKIHNVRTIVVDPRYSDTAVGIGDEWVALRPGTDAALIAAIIYVLVSEKKHDQKFLDKYCVGFNEETLPKEAKKHSSYHSYIFGKGPDKTKKTPEWAAKITGVPAGDIIRLARELGDAKRVAISQGWGPQRHANGENQARSIFTLAAVLGQIGLVGGGTGGREASFGLPMVYPFNHNTTNPVETAISVFSWTDGVERGAEMTATRDGVRGADKLSTDIKMIWQYAGNALTNQHSDVNRTVNLLRDDSKCELIVVSDIQMTVSARYADIILPDTSTAEQLDLIREGSSSNMGYSIIADQAIEPLYNCKPIYWVCSELAKRLGIEKEYTEGRTQEEWVKHSLDLSRENIPDLPDFETFRKQGMYKVEGKSVIPLKEFREDPKANPLGTPSGKIEIYSQQLQDMSETWEFDPAIKGDKLTALPEYVATWEGAEEAKTNTDFPLQVIGHHFKGRTHSSYGNVDMLEEAHHQRVWINTIDARERGIEIDDIVEVFNERGRIQSPAYVTPRIVPGTISVPQGSWYNPRSAKSMGKSIPSAAELAEATKEPASIIDIGGSVNTLTSWHPSPLAKGNAQHTTLGQVVRISGPDGKGAALGAGAGPDRGAYARVRGVSGGGGITSKLAADASTSTASPSASPTEE